MSFDLINIKKRIDLNTFICDSEIEFMWNSLNFKVIRFYSNGFKFKFVPCSYYEDLIKKEIEK